MGAKPLAILHNYPPWKPEFGLHEIFPDPGYSEVMPYEPTTEAQLTKKLRIPTPFLSAAMAFVSTEFAVGLANKGGFPVFSTLGTQDDREAWVREVKRRRGPIIEKPRTVRPYNTVDEANRLMNEYTVSGVPVITEDRTLVGIITRRDVPTHHDTSMKVEERMTHRKDLLTAPPDISLKDAIKLMEDNRLKRLLLVYEDGKLAGLMTLKDSRNASSYENAAKDKGGRLMVGAAVSVLGSKDDPEMYDRFHKAEVDAVVVDTSHGDHSKVVETVKFLKKRFGDDFQVIGGNVTNYGGIVDLYSAGADAGKVGIAIGNNCSTLEEAGAARMQGSAVWHSARASSELGLPIISDGSHKKALHIDVSLALGADTVMLGSMFVPAKEALGRVRYEGGKATKHHYGMASDEAKAKRFEINGLDISRPEISGGRYLELKGKTFAEGFSTEEPYEDKSISEMMDTFTGKLKAFMSHHNARTIPDLWKNFSEPQLDGPHPKSALRYVPRLVA